MNIYLVSRTDAVGYDEYDSWVVCAENEEDALCSEPYGDEKPRKFPQYKGLEVELIGEAVKGSTFGIVLSSFNAC